MSTRQQSPLQAKFYEIIFGTETPAGKWFDICLIVVITASVAIIMFDSIGDLHARYGQQGANRMSHDLFDNQWYVFWRKHNVLLLEINRFQLRVFGFGRGQEVFLDQFPFVEMECLRGGVGTFRVVGDHDEGLAQLAVES